MSGWASSSNGDFEGMGLGRADIFVVRCDKRGDITWKKTFCGILRDFGNCVASTTDGGCIMTGMTESFDGTFETSIN